MNMSNSIDRLSNLIKQNDTSLIYGVQNSRVFEFIFKAKYLKCDYFKIGSEELDGICLNPEKGIDSITQGNSENKIKIISFNAINKKLEEVDKIINALVDLQVQKDLLKDKKCKIVLFLDHSQIEILNFRKGDSSYPFTEGTSVFYCSEYYFHFHEYSEFIKKSKEFKIDYDLWKNLLSYTNGELFSTFFFMEEISGKSINEKTLFEIIKNNSDMYLKNYYSRRKDYIDFKTMFKETGIELSIASDQDERKTELIKRSNLYTKNNQYQNLLIYKINGYVGSHILNQIHNKNLNDIKIAKPILPSSLEIISDALTIENSLRNTIEDFLRDFKDQFENIPIKFNESQVSLYGEEQKKRIQNKGIFGYEKESSYLSVFTFKEIINILNVINQIIYINEEKSYKVKNQNNTLERITLDSKGKISSNLIKDITINKGSLLYYRKFKDTNKNTDKVLIVNLKHAQYYLISPEVEKNIIGRNRKKYLEHIFIDQQNTKIPKILRNDEEVNKNLEKINHYRNAVAHSRDLSDSTKQQFTEIVGEFYFNLHKVK